MLDDLPDSLTGDTVVRLPTRTLRRHEQIDMVRAESLFEQIVGVDAWMQPLLVERHSSVVLDGHHRFWCACQLGLVRVPAICIEYCDPDLTLETWRPDFPVTIDDVLTAARTGRLLPQKTSRHRLARGLPSCNISLSDLRESRAA